MRGLFETMYRDGRLAAVPCGKMKRVPVRVQCNGTTQTELLRNYGNEPYRWFIVQASTAAQAANYVRDMADWPPNTEIKAIGPKQGETERFIGYESFIGREISKPREKNLDLFR